MSEHLTHIAVYEDVARLAIASDRFPEAFTESLRDQWDVGMLTSASRGNHLFAVPLIEKYGPKWNTGDRGATTKNRIAAALGWLGHRAADLQMKPLSWKLEAELEAGPNPLGLDVSEFQIYQDGVTFREVYAGGAVPPGGPFGVVSRATLETGMASHPAAALAEAEPLVVAQITRGLLELHTPIHTPAGDAAAWLDAYYDRRQRTYEDLRIYIEAFVDPDPVKAVAYLDAPPWYDAEDAAIRWARALQRETPPPPTIGLVEAVEAARTGSQYAQALHKGWAFFSAAADYYRGTLSKSGLYDAIEVFTPEHRAFAL